jgi:hypothetical protein
MEDCIVGVSELFTFLLKRSGHYDCGNGLVLGGIPYPYKGSSKVAIVIEVRGIFRSSQLSEVYRSTSASDVVMYLFSATAHK